MGEETLVVLELIWQFMDVLSGHYKSWRWCSRTIGLYQQWSSLGRGRMSLARHMLPQQLLSEYANETIPPEPGSDARLVVMGQLNSGADKLAAWLEWGW